MDNEAHKAKLNTIHATNVRIRHHAGMFPYVTLLDVVVNNKRILRIGNYSKEIFRKNPQTLSFSKQLFQGVRYRVTTICQILTNVINVYGYISKLGMFVCSN